MVSWEVYRRPRGLRGGTAKGSLAFALLGATLAAAPWPGSEWALASPDSPLPGRNVRTLQPLAATSGSAKLEAAAAQIVQVPYYDLTCDGLATFDDIPGGLFPGTYYPNVIESGGALFGEHFDGQTVQGRSDVVSGTPSDPLWLRPGKLGENLRVYFLKGSQTVEGVDPSKASNTAEGAVACLFDYDQSEVGFEVWYGNGGHATVLFYRRNGSLVDSIVITDLGHPSSYGFRRADGSHDIAGIVIQNSDLGGITFDNICHDVSGIPGQPPICMGGGPYAAGVDVPVQFDATRSYDPDGRIDSYRWDFGDGGVATGATPEHSYAAVGTYDVTLCVVDHAGLESCCETRAEIGGTTPTSKTSWGRLKVLYR